MLQTDQAIYIYSIETPSLLEEKIGELKRIDIGTFLLNRWVRYIIENKLVVVCEQKTSLRKTPVKQLAYV